MIEPDLLEIGRPSARNVSNSWNGQQTTAFGNLPPEPPEPPEPAEVVSASAAQTLPSTRTGGQDDGS